MRIEVLKAGTFSSIQDQGRHGFRAFGVPASGVMDEWSAAIANALVGNEPNDPLIEMTLTGGSFRFDSAATIALSGADMGPVLNDVPIEMNKAVEIKAGDRLDLGPARKGCRCYLSVQGSLQADQVMGSASVYQVGGFGRSLIAGDVISVIKKTPKKLLKEAKGKIYLPTSVKLRFIAGPEWQNLSTVEQKKFLQTTYSLHQNSDRMGIRLQADHTLDLEMEPMLSSPTTTGCIQLTNSGLPVVLMKDGQTTGGYPRLGTVIRMDLNRLSQLKPGEKVRFELISYEESAALWKAYQNNLQNLYI